MSISVKKLNSFLLIKLPAAFLCGVRTTVLDDDKCAVSVKHRWIDEGHKVDEAIKSAIDTGEGQTVWLNSKGINQDGVQVSDFNFEWTLRVKP